MVNPSLRAWRAAVSSTVIQRAVAKPARSTSWSSATKPSSGSAKSRTTWLLGDLHPDPVQQRHKPLRRHLPLGVQRQHKAPQLRAEAADDPGRQVGQHRLARRQHPALAPVADHLGRKPQVAAPECLRSP